MKVHTPSGIRIGPRRHLFRARVSFLAALLLSGCGGPDHEGEQASTPAVAKALGINVENLDRSVRPQDDFFRFVNGRWLATTAIPADKARYGVFDELADESEKNQRLIIEEAAAHAEGERSRAEQQVGDLYRSFMDKERIDQLGIAPIEPYLAQIDGLDSKDALTAYLADAYRYGVNGPLVFFVSIDFKDPSQYIVYVTQSGLGLPDRDYYFLDDERTAGIRQKYVSFMQQVLGLAGFADPPASAKRIIEIETGIARGQWTRVENRDREKTYNRYSVAQLEEKMANFHWPRYLSAVHLDTIDDLVVRQPTYLEKLDELYRDLSLEDWKLYLKWQVINTHLSYLSEPFDSANFDFYSRTLSGTEEQRERWKRAVSLVNRSIGELVGQVYVQRYFNPESKERMKQLVQNLREAFSEGIDELDWMSDKTKEEAHRKLAKFTSKIGYPDKWRDYSTLRIDAGDLVGNFARISAFEMDYDIARLGKPIDRDEWFMTPQTVNAYYYPPLNEIVFPAAILQPPFFNPAADDAVNYGAIGTVIGHEMSHGFDDQGRKTDGDGALRDWWTEEDAAAFKDRTAKLVAQYDNYYPVPDSHINGELTLGENIGDLSGLAVAYRAYRISLAGRQAPVIDGFTGDQRFCMGFAQAFREQIRDEDVARRIKTDPHSPSEFRVLGVVSNFQPFYAAFDVHEGDRLWRAPEERVKIW